MKDNENSSFTAQSKPYWELGENRMKFRSKSRSIGAIVATGAVLVGGLAFAAPAEAATPPKLSLVGAIAAAAPSTIASAAQVPTIISGANVIHSTVAGTSVSVPV
jgi:hypothetical protein